MLTTLWFVFFVVLFVTSLVLTHLVLTYMSPKEQVLRILVVTFLSISLYFFGKNLISCMLDSDVPPEEPPEFKLPVCESTNECYV